MDIRLLGSSVPITLGRSLLNSSKVTIELRRVKCLIDKAKGGCLHEYELGLLQELAESGENAGQSASLLRLGRRLSRVVGASCVDLDRGLARLYWDRAQNSTNETERLRFSSWAQRYDPELVVPTFDGDLATVVEWIHNEVELGKRCLIAASAGLRVTMEDEGTVVARLPDERFILGQVGPGSSFQSRWAGDESEVTGIVFSGWSLFGQSTAGPKPKNEDRLAICASGGAILAAVADGTGDSMDGARASTVALSSLRLGFLCGFDLCSAVDFALLGLEADNLVEHLDGACTLSVTHIDERKTEVARVGDAFYGYLDSNGDSSFSDLDPSERSVLGPEPLGPTITSSARLTQPLGRLELEGLERSVRIILLGSDGLLGSRPRTAAELVGAMTRAAHPDEVVRHLVSSSLEKMRNGERSPDNVSAVACVREGV